MRKYTLILIFSTLIFSSCKNMDQGSGKRTPGTYIDDLVLDLGLVERTIRKSDEGFKGSHIVVEVFNGNVLVVGQVRSQTLKEKATIEIKKLKNVTDGEVHNYLQVAPPTTMLARTNDAYITTKVKAKLAASGLSVKKRGTGGKIKVLTEDGIVYLMGITSKDQSDNVTTIVSSIYGIREIVKIFDELN